MNTTFLEILESDFDENNAQDLYFIIHESLKNRKLSFLNILFLISEGFGITSSENNGFSLDQDWDIPEDFNHVAFFIGAHESSRLSLKDFLNLMNLVASRYLLENPQDKEAVEINLKKLSMRYEKLLYL